MKQTERDALAARVREDAAWAASAERAAEEAEYVRLVVQVKPSESTATVSYEFDTVPPRTFANVRAAGQAWRWVVGGFFLIWALAVLYAVVTR